MSTEPKKDIIYIDTEDDITAVIDKVKGAQTAIVALVPPKRVGVLQSIVNLKLLKRTAETANKRIVLITGDQALTGLAGSLAMPVAKNLQSKPQVPSVSSDDNLEDEVIDGSQLSVGEHARLQEDELDVSEVAPDAKPGAAAISAPFAAKAAERAPKKGSKLKIPNFDTFRKKLFVFGGLGVLLILFLVWAIFFAGKATVAITAKTNIVNINETLQLKEGATLSASQAVAPAIVKTVKKTNTVDFTATGKKEVGEKATGTIRYSNDSLSAVSVPAGTILQTSGGLSFRTTSEVSVPGAGLGNCNGRACVSNGSATGGVEATASGSRFNSASGDVGGAPDGLSASFSSPAGGGTDRTITVVSQADVNQASTKLQSQDNQKAKDEVKKQFEGTDIIINESYSVSAADPTSAPAVGQEAGTAKLTAETTYALVGVSRSNLRAIYDAKTKSQISKENSQRIYESGDDKTSFSEFNAVAGGGYSVRAQATAQVGPNIDDKVLSAQLVGKRSGEIQQQIEAIQGVENVDVRFSPFWVTKAPSKAEKISIKFVLQND